MSLLAWSLYLMHRDPYSCIGLNCLKCSQFAWIIGVNPDSVFYYLGHFGATATRMALCGELLLWPVYEYVGIVAPL